MDKVLNDTERKLHTHITERLIRARARLEGPSDDDRTHAGTRATIQELKQLLKFIEENKDG